MGEFVYLCMINGSMSKRRSDSTGPRRPAQTHQRRKADAPPSNLDAPIEQGIVITQYGATLELLPIDPGTADPCAIHTLTHNSLDPVRCIKRSPLPALTTGDHVLWQRQRSDDAAAIRGRVIELQPRRSLMVRPDSRGTLRPVAANIDCIAIVAAPYPPTPASLIDRYLVACHAQSIDAVIVFNKQDLSTQYPQYLKLYQCYQALGYATYAVSTQSKQGLATLKHRLLQQTSIFVGQSGVGKSSLINALIQDPQQQSLTTGPVSCATGKGRHTTPTTALYPLAEHSWVIDSPGVREFTLWSIPLQQVIAAFIDLAPLADHCQFRNCQHHCEPGCAILAALQDERIDPQRYASFKAIYASIQGAC